MKIIDKVILPILCVVIFALGVGIVYVASDKPSGEVKSTVPIKDIAEVKETETEQEEIIEEEPEQEVVEEVDELAEFRTYNGVTNIITSNFDPIKAKAKREEVAANWEIIKANQQSAKENYIASQKKKNNNTEQQDKTQERVVKDAREFFKDSGIAREVSNRYYKIFDLSYVDSVEELGDMTRYIYDFNYSNLRVEIDTAFDGSVLDWRSYAVDNSDNIIVLFHFDLPDDASGVYEFIKANMSDLLADPDAYFGTSYEDGNTDITVHEYTTNTKRKGTVPGAEEED